MSEIFLQDRLDLLVNAIVSSGNKNNDLKTYEMVASAELNGKMYKSNDMYYHKDKGFIDSKGDLWDIKAYEFYDNPLYDFIHECGWEEYEPEYTLDDLYKIVGHKFSIKS